MPRGDVIEHVLTADCPCGPAEELVRTRWGDRWMVVHHSLDGRELIERPLPDLSPQPGPGWSAGQP